MPSDTLERAVALLDASLPIFRRDLAYALANIRRVEQKLKQTHQEFQQREQALRHAMAEGGKQVKGMGNDLGLSRQVAIALKQEYDTLAQKAEQLKLKITLTEQQVSLGQERLKTQKTKVQIAKRRKYYYMAMGVIDSTFLVNAIEHPVYEEALLQHADLPVDVRVKFKPIEIAAFALNRLPSMYAATTDEYQQQLSTAQGELKPKIIEAVKRGIKTLRMGDPLYDSTPLPDQLFCESGGLLGCLSVAFNRKDLRWSDIPQILQRIGDHQQQRSPAISPANSSSYAQRYLQRSKFRQGDQVKIDKNNSELEQKFLDLYTLRGKLKYVNVIEKLVVVQALSLAIDVNGQAHHAIVLAHTLNRFPPMYTTSERGLNQLCKIFFENHAQKVNQKIIQSFEQLKSSLNQNHEYLIFRKFREEYQLAMLEIAKIFKRNDLTPENLVDVLTEFVNQ